MARFAALILASLLDTAAIAHDNQRPETRAQAQDAEIRALYARNLLLNAKINIMVCNWDIKHLATSFTSLNYPTVDLAKAVCRRGGLTAEYAAIWLWNCDCLKD